MGMFSRLKTVISSHINAWISKAEKPEKMLNQLILDMNEQLIESKKAVAQAIADEKKLERETANQKALAQEWERKAMLAVEAGKDDLAREALLRKQDYENTAAEYEKQHLAQKDAVEKLKSALRELQTKIDEAQRKKNLLIARAKRAEAQQKIQDTMSGMAGGGKASFDTFDRMARKVDELEAHAEASKELADFSADSDLEKQFAQLEKSDSSADAMLLELKQKMGALPSPAGAAGALPDKTT
ncbi:MAG: PspA/IM30 family protein [Spirochaetaceae bacterium]|jgi:phage shock protein A|nr:PspA/IM30 family protein [Spirochaetaceae bacterium]